MEILLPWQHGNVPKLSLMKVFYARIWVICSLQQCVSWVYLTAMETLLPWQPENCAITQLCESDLISYLAHVFFGIKYVTGLPGCYGNAVTMATS